MSDTNRFSATRAGKFIQLHHVLNNIIIIIILVQFPLRVLYLKECTMVKLKALGNDN